MNALFQDYNFFHRIVYLSCQLVITLFCMSRKALPAIVWKEGEWFVAKTVGLELASQGRNKKEALDNLQEALDLLLEDEGVKTPPASIPQKPELNRVYTQNT